MSMDSRYKEEMDSFCRRAYKVGGEEMLQMAKMSAIDITDGKAVKKSLSKKALLIPIAAAVFGMTAVTAAAGAAGYGPLSGVMSKYFGDPVTSKLAEEGYVYTAEDYAADSAADSSADKESGERVNPVMGEALTKDIFTARVVGFAGDTQSPQMLVDITVNDSDIAAQNDMIGAYILTLGAEEFEKNRDSYFVEYGKGSRDETVPNLYHVSVRTPPAWVTSGDELVVDIVNIHILNDKNPTPPEYYREDEETDRGLSGGEFYEKLDERKVEMQFRFTLPENIFKETTVADYRPLNAEYEIDGNSYHLWRGEFGDHDTYFSLDYAFEGDPGTFYNDFEKSTEVPMSAAEKFVLNVDGKEYAPVIENCGVYCDDTGICNLCIKDRCYLTVFFPVIDYENAESVTLTANGQTYELTGCITARE